MTDNELIAEFMGGEVDGDMVYFQNIPSQLTLNYNWTISQLQYHISWDWLMPVVEKIEDLTRSNKIVGNLMSMWTYYYNVFNGTINTDITVAYQLVVEFIKWYNKQNEN